MWSQRNITVALDFRRTPEDLFRSVPFESGIAKGEKPKKFLNALKKFNVKAVVAGKRRVVEKTPKHIQCIGKILKWSPEAKIIIIVRDGRDVAYSIKQRTGSLEEGIQRWMDDNLSAKEFWNHPNVYLVKYEQIIEDFEGSLTGILSHLGEAYDATLLVGGPILLKILVLFTCFPFKLNETISALRTTNNVRNQTYSTSFFYKSCQRTIMQFMATQKQLFNRKNLTKTQAG